MFIGNAADLNKLNLYSGNPEKTAIFIATHLKKAHYDIAITATKNSKTICLHYQKR